MFTFRWYIENFSALNPKSGEYIDSPHYKIKSMNNIEVFMRLYPRGRISNESTICYLLTNSKPIDTEVNIKLKFTNGKFSRAEEYAVNKGHVTALYVAILRKEFDLIRSHSLYEDNVVFESFISKRNLENPDHFTVRTVAQIEQHSYDLPLNKYLISRPSSWKRILQFSKDAWFGQGSEKLKIIIDFEKSTSSLAVEISKESQSDARVVMFCKLLLCSEEKTVYLADGEQLFKDKDDIWKASFDIRKDDASNSFLRCELKLSKGTVISYVEANDLSIPAAETTSSEENVQKGCKILDYMYKNKKFCDVTLQVGSEQFPAHKCVLSATSDVFAAMFETNMKENQSSVVTINDIDKTTISEMLLFLYTEKTGNLDLEELLKLYSASDKYQILNLKKYCSSELEMKVAIENACEMLEIANLHQDRLLEDFIRSFIYSNRKKICCTENWKSLMERRLELASDVMLQICLRF